MRIYYLLLIKLLACFVFVCATNLSVFAQTDVDGGVFFFAKAENFRKKKQYSDAVIEYGRAILADPTNYRFPFSKAMCHQLLEQVDSAVKYFEMSIKLKDDYVPAYVAVSRCYKAKTATEKQVNALQQAFTFEESFEKKLEYKMEIIESLIRSEDFVNAKLHINGFKKFKPDANLDILYYEARISNRLGDYHTAKSCMLTATKMLKTPALKEIARYYYELGYAYYKLKEYEEASQAWQNANFGEFRKLISQYDPRYHYITAQCMFKIYEYGLAQKYLESALHIRHDFAPAQVFMAKIAIRHAKHDAAIKHYHEALKLENKLANRGDIYEEMTEILLNSGHYKQAVESANECLKIKPRSYEVVLQKAMAYYKMKNYHEASLVLEELIASNKDMGNQFLAPYYFALGVIYRAYSVPEKAKEAYKKAAFGTFADAARIEYQNLNAEMEEE